MRSLECWGGGNCGSNYTSVVVQSAGGGEVVILPAKIIRAAPGQATRPSVTWWTRLWKSGEWISEGKGNVAFAWAVEDMDVQRLASSPDKAETAAVGRCKLLVY